MRRYASGSVTCMTRTPSCFIAMPITVHDEEAELYGDSEHWAHVMNHLFVPAIKAAGYEPVIPSASGTSMIHGRIIKYLVEADMVLCDLSQHNPNVLFELGVRTSLDRPVALVKDEHLKLPFDIQGLNTYHYASKLSPWSLDQQVTALTSHIVETGTASGSSNPLWAHFGVSISASQPPSAESPEDAKLQLILEKVQSLATPNPTATSPRRVGRFAEQDKTFFGEALSALDGVTGVSIADFGDGPLLAKITTEPSTSEVQLQRTIEAMSAMTMSMRGVRASAEDTSAEEIVLRISLIDEPDSVRHRRFGAREL